MFELPRNIIYGSTWYFPKYDMMMIRVMITAVTVQHFLIFSSASLFSCFLFLYLPAAHYFTNIFLFILLHLFHCHTWQCPHGFIYTQVHSPVISFYIAWVISFTVLLQFPSGETPMKPNYNTELCNCGRSRALICIMPWYIFCNVFPSTYLYLPFPFLFLCTLFYKPGFFTFSSHHRDLSNLDSCAETRDFEILLQKTGSFLPHLYSF